MISPTTIKYGAIVLAIVAVNYATYHTTASFYEKEHQLYIEKTNAEHLAEVVRIQKQSQEYQQQLQENINKKELDYANEISKLQDVNNTLVATNKRLYIKINKSANSTATNSTSGSASSSNGKATFELPNEASQFLLSITNEADRDRAALNLCKDYIKETIDINNKLKKESK